MNDIDTLTANVERGATWLDDVRPGWYLEIDVADLDLSSPTRCVLGQLGTAVAVELGVPIIRDGYNLFVEGPRTFGERCVLNLLNAAEPLGFHQADMLGFDFDDDDIETSNYEAIMQERYRDLDDLWIKAIKRRVDA